MHEMNIAKLTASDLGLFTAITKDLFPGVDPPLVDFSTFRDAVANELIKMGLQVHSKLIKITISILFF